MEKGVFNICGSPETVRRKLEQHVKELGVGVVLTGCQTGTLPQELTKAACPELRTEEAVGPTG